jgi:CRP/FNR family cyclic AMP-dependent transcriptional regulator
MPMEGLERIVLEHPFFAGLGPEFGAAISGCARNLRFAGSEYLFREDEPANEFYLIRHGTGRSSCTRPASRRL